MTFHTEVRLASDRNVQDPRPAYVVNFPGGEYVLDEDGARRFEAMLKAYGKPPAEIGME
jgi:hypothetical protein